jgi:hypothetical protein
MGWWWQSVRGIVEAKTFQESYDALRLLNPVLDRVKVGVDWQLAINPTAGKPIEGVPHWYRIYTVDKGAPSFVIIYRYEEDPEGDERVELQDIAVNFEDVDDWFLWERDDDDDSDDEFQAGWDL